MENRILQRYTRFCYRLGRGFDRNPHEGIAKMLYQADVEMTTGTFISLWIVTSILAGIVLLLVAFGLFMILMPASPDTAMIVIEISADDYSSAPLGLLSGLLLRWEAIFVALIGIVVCAVGFPFYLQNQISNKKLDIERQIPYALAFMSIMASSGTTPLEMLRRVVKEDYGHISKEFSKVLFRVDVLGEDAVTAMNALVNNTPSEVFRSICIDLTNIMLGGGGLTEYLVAKSRELMEIRRQTYKEFVESLAVYGEGYLGGIVMLITLGVLGIVISGALSIELGPFTPTQMFQYLIYLVTPLINVIFLQLLSVKYSTNP